MSFRQSSLYRQYFNKSPGESSIKDDKSDLGSRTPRPQSPFQNIERNNTFINKLSSSGQSFFSPRISRQQSAQRASFRATSPLNSPFEQNDQISQYAANQIIHDTQKQLWGKQRAQFRQKIKVYEQKLQDYEACREELTRLRKRNQILEREYKSLVDGYNQKGIQIPKDEYQFRPIDSNSYVYTYGLGSSSAGQPADGAQNLNIGSITSRYTTISPIARLSTVQQRTDETQRTIKQQTSPEKYHDSKSHPIWNYQSQGIGMFGHMQQKSGANQGSESKQKGSSYQKSLFEEKIKELENRVDQLKQEKQKALQNFKTLKTAQENECAELRTEQTRLKRQLEQIIEMKSDNFKQAKRLRQKAQKEESHKNRLKRQNSDLAQQLAEVKAKLKKVKQSLEIEQKQKQEEINKIKNRLRGLNDQNSLNQIKQTKQLKKQIFMEKQSLEKQMQNIKRTNQELQKKALQATTLNEGLLVKLSSSEELLMKMKADYLSMAESEKSHLFEKEGLKNEKKELIQTLDQRDKEINRLKSSIEKQVQSRRVAIAFQKAQMGRNLKTMQTKLSSLNAVINFKENEISKQRADIEGLLREVVRLRGVGVQNNKLKELYKLNVQKDEGIEHLWAVKEAQYESINRLLAAVGKVDQVATEKIVKDEYVQEN